MKNKKQDLTDDELYDLLIQRKSSGREARIAAFRAAGRIVDEENAPINKELGLTGERRSVERVHKQSFTRKIDKVLLFIEILAVIGIVVILVKGTRILKTMNREAAQAFVMPTLTPTALVQAIVLPGGHTVPDEGGNTGFNESEIPEHLRNLVNVSATSVPMIDTGESLIRISIPSINVDAPIVNGDNWEDLKTGVGLNGSSSRPGEPGNVILSGHNDIFGEVFRNLDQLKTGDKVLLLTEKNAYTYTVTDTKIVSPNQVDVLDQTKDRTLTLISCYPYLVDTQRFVVTAKQ